MNIIQTISQCRDLRDINISIHLKQALCLHSWECMVDSDWLTLDVELRNVIVKESSYLHDAVVHEVAGK